MNNGINRVLLFQHLIFWIGFLFINFYVSITFLPLGVGLFRFTMLTLINICVYWYCFKYSVDRFYETKRYALFVWILAGVIVLSSASRLLILGIIHEFFHMPVPQPILISGVSFGVVIVIFTQGVVVAMAVLLGISRNKFITEKRLNELSAIKSQTELALLKAKINPHFLLNTLNNIYYYSGENNEKGSSAILKLGELLRYTTYDSAQARITVEKELMSIESLSELYGLRFNSLPNIKISVHDSYIKKIAIPPGILLILFENAIKYSAVGSEKNSYVKLDIYYEDGALCFKVENSIASADKSLQNIYGGMGLSSLKQILELEYANKYKLETDEKNSIFTAQLNLSDE